MTLEDEDTSFLPLIDPNVPYVEEVPKFEVDLSMHFNADKAFGSKEELMEWARSVSQSLGYVLTIKTSDQIVGRLAPRVILACDRGGHYRENQCKKGWVKKGVRKTTPKRCGCMFSLKGMKVVNVEEWRVEVLCGVHNHEKVHLEAHAYAARLNVEEERLVSQMYTAGVKPQKILSAVKTKCKSNRSVMKTIYNARVKLQKKELEGLSPTQYLYKLIDVVGYISYNVVDDSNIKLRSIFFAHPLAVKLTNMFPTVFELDCTYKTNRYRLPLLCIVGMTSTMKSFYSCFVFLSDETQPSYEWALHCFKSILNGSEPTVMITDREVALMNVIGKVFPAAKNILCRVHINRNILAHCKKLFTNGKEFETFMFEWQRLIEAATESELSTSFNNLLVKYSGMHSDVLNYVVTTWIEPYKDRFVSAWINRFMHLGNSSTNRVEGGHSLLKKFLEVSVGTLTTVWRTFDQMINLQHTEIRKSFGESCIKISNDHKGHLYSELIGKISKQALELITEEEDVIRKGEHFKQAYECQHIKRYTLGLPCGHELHPYIVGEKVIPLWLINSHWKHLSLKENVEVDIDNNLDVELEEIVLKFYDSNEHQKKEIKQKLREIVHPTTTRANEPSIPLKLKGRPKGSYKKFKEEVLSTKRLPSHFEYALMETKTLKKPTKVIRKKLVIRRNTKFVDRGRNQFSPFWSAHIIDAFDVLGDGHCGYRVISQALNIPGDWQQVRNDLQWELQNHESLYSKIFGLERYEELLEKVKCIETPAPYDKWMAMPDMGLVITSRYNIGLVQLSEVQNLTFFPLHSAMSEVPQMVCIGFLNESHFIQVTLNECSSIPHIVPTLDEVS